MTKKWLLSYNVRVGCLSEPAEDGRGNLIFRFLPYNPILKLFLMDKVQKIDKI
jgi:hypothetical protein